MKTMPDALQLLADQHQEVDHLFTEMASTGEPARRRAILEAIAAALTRHASLEEELFYPTVRGRIIEGDGYITTSLQEHEKATVQLRKLDRMQATDPLFDPSIGELEREVREHIADEELQLFPRVRAVFSAGELAELGSQLAGRTTDDSSQPNRMPASQGERS